MRVNHQHPNQKSPHFSNFFASRSPHNWAPRPNAVACADPLLTFRPGFCEFCMPVAINHQHPAQKSPHFSKLCAWSFLHFAFASRLPRIHKVHTKNQKKKRCEPRWIIRVLMFGVHVSLSLFVFMIPTPIENSVAPLLIRFSLECP